MDVDNTALIFIVEYYEMLVNEKDKLPNAYAEGAPLFMYIKNQPLKVVHQQYQNVIPNGVRTITNCSGEVINGKLYVHVQSTLAQPSIAKVDECFTCQLKDSCILILHHSIHVNPIIEPLPKLPPPPPPKPVVKPEPKPAPKPRDPPIEVDSPDKFIQRFTIFVKNLPFQVAPKEFLAVIEKHGHVSHFMQGKGKLLAQMEDPKIIGKITHLPEFEWNGRKPRIMRMPVNLIWD
ncbi:hypothetical protein GPJ56_006526 [Histomonas meleagridis]|uniref:uncharacterized protein n=1 Tax=Histomonas meleagridis TaxID=135588 RepID=UPI00355A618E|nr:hypothetical protein GPJ56_006526 [Histomonas meleagridis]KAH0801763.1 hypothetical protein GO595_005444 [Histomonas meleagridis]